MPSVGPYCSARAPLRRRRLGQLVQQVGREGARVRQAAAGDHLGPRRDGHEVAHGRRAQGPRSTGVQPLVRIEAGVRHRHSLGYRLVIPPVTPRWAAGRAGGSERDVAARDGDRDHASRRTRRPAGRNPEGVVAARSISSVERRLELGVGVGLRAVGRRGVLVEAGPRSGTRRRRPRSSTRCPGRGRSCARGRCSRRAGPPCRTRAPGRAARPGPP